MMDAIMRAIEPVRRRVDNLVARATLNKATDSPQLQEVQITIRTDDELGDEVRDRCERVQDYGFTSVPHPGAEAVALSVAGHRGHVLVIAVFDRRYRKKDLQPGETAMYTDEGDYFTLLRGRVAELVAGTKFRVDTPLVECTGRADVTGSVNTADVFKVDGTQVVGPRQGAITKPIAGATVDAQARTAINAIIDALSPSGHGLTS